MARATGSPPITGSPPGSPETGARKITTSSATLSSTNNPGDTFPVGITTVTYTATDGATNTQTASFTVTVTDDADPTWAFVPANQNLTATPGQCGTTFTWGTKAFGPWVGWMGGWGVAVAGMVAWREEITGGW